MRIDLPDDEVARKILSLATEDELSVPEFLKKLVEKEDRDRHVDRSPIQYQGGMRVKCPRMLCQETLEPWNSVYETEIGN
jgi:hypothetical protein